MGTINPPTLVTLGQFWVDQGGVNLGVVGDTAHAAKGYSYHLGRDQLDPTAYSIKTARDKAGLSDAASAIDLGKLDGSFGPLREFSKWLVAQGQANAPGTSDIREIIYTPDGKTVLRWDRERGFASAPKTGEADDSHLTHTHISWYRDAEKRDHTIAFRPYFEDAMVKYTAPSDEVGGTITTKVATLAIPITGGTRPSLRAGLTRPALGVFTLDDLADRPCYLMLVGTDICFVAAADVTFTPDDGPNPPATTQSQKYVVTVNIGGKAVTAGEVTLP